MSGSFLRTVGLSTHETLTVTLVSVVLLLVGCGDRTTRGYHLNEKSFDAQALRMVEDSIGFGLPKGTRGLHMFYVGSSIDPAFVAKVEIPTSEWETTVAKIQGLEGIPHAGDNDVYNSLTGQVKWWSPTNRTVFKRYYRVHCLVGVWCCKEDAASVLYLEWVTF